MDDKTRDEIAKWLNPGELIGIVPGLGIVRNPNYHNPTDDHIDTIGSRFDPKCRIEILGPAEEEEND